jgi:uncharacterized protein YndB with AHSA1/START domain
MATANEVGTLTVTTPSDREVVMARTFDAPRELVWDAHTSPDHLPKWMLGPQDWEMSVCDVDLRPGGAYRLIWRKPDGEQMEISGSYREVSPPERLVSTESWGAEWPEMVNTMVLSEEGGRTTVTTTILYDSKEDRDKALGTGMTDGASWSYDRLDEYLRSIG